MDKLFSFVVLFVITSWPGEAAARRLIDVGVYHDHVMMTQSLELLRKQYPDLTHLYQIGESVEGRSLSVIAISGSSPDSHVTLRPEVKYVGNMHGNEVVGKEMLLHFAEHLLTNYGKDDDVTRLLDNTRIHIMPSINPDGSEISVEGVCKPENKAGRWNSNDVDLNRNFPDFFEDTGIPIQKETQAVMDWLETEHFVLSANFHGGALVANYPLDNLDPAKKELYYSLLRDPNQYSACSDDDVFRFLALTYSTSHSRMRIYNETTRWADFTPESGFKDGVTNGADWYAVAGGLQDYNYFEAGCFEVTMEIGACKHPGRGKIIEYWDENRSPMVEYLKQVHRGIRGIVTNRTNKVPVHGASVKVFDRNLPQKTTKLGEFWLILLPGKYVIEVSMPGFWTEQLDVDVQQDLYQTSRLDVKLLSTSSQLAPSLLLIIMCIQVFKELSGL